MGLRIATNVPAMNAQRNLEASSQEAAKAMSRLSSGERIVHAGDDAAGLAISKKLEGEVRSLQQAQRNANDGVSFVQTAEGSLNEVSNILIRLREIGVQSASDTIGDNERTFLDKEFQTLSQEIDRISSVTQFQGKPLINGEGGELSFQVGAHKGGDQLINYNAAEANATVSALGISGVSVESRENALDSLESIDQAANLVNGYRANLGALQNRLHSASNTVGNQVENLSEAKSRIADTDIALEASNLMKSTIIQNAGIAVLAQANSMSAGALKLL